MPTASRRELHKQRTRAAIAETGVALFRRHGFDRVTVADIASAADIAPRTFHRYFPDREELVFADAPADLDVLRAALLAHPPDPVRPLDALGEVLAAMARVFEGRLDAARAQLALVESTPALRARDLSKQAAIEDELTARLAEPLGVAPDHDLRPRLWAKIGLACFFSAYRSWAHHGGSLAEHLASALAELRNSR